MTPSAHPAPEPGGPVPLRRVELAALAVSGGVLYFLGFPGFDLAPCAFVALVPLVVMLEALRTGPTRPLVGYAFLYGLVEYFGGYAWMNAFLEEFSGFPPALTLLITLVFCAALALFQVAFALIYRAARARGAGIFGTVVCGTLLLESFYPMIFPSYLGNALHVAPRLAQLADLGGPLLVSALVATVNGALAEVAMARRERAAFPTRPVVAAAAAFVAALAYGSYRVHEVDARAASAPRLDVAMVQVNMGTFQKREDPYEGHRRHLEQSWEVERQGPPDLFVWPESAFTFYAPREEAIARVVTPELTTPVLFGGLDRRLVGERYRPFNTAFLIDANDRVSGRYDKRYLVPFGETIPLGETFPVLYEWSPNSGNFARGTSLAPLSSGPARMSVFVCYEDLLPDYVRDLVREGRPNLLVNLTNDAWYGDTHEPWIHLALAKFRAIEHHRALVRSTNSGVSAFVDPVGRVVRHSGVFTRETLRAEVPLLDRGTVFEVVGQTPSTLAALLYFAFVAARAARRR